ncbi:unnamed protein product [Bursaphelenchus okinawaensis]|uniref:proline--tRNA ligase n=1 Tax=Bursaphelenchus okinawaensis TaxID=465554 RepID=A0A811K6G9_9BILA|nr:unnamed protein product [Bursaphelenchus okinawaensis]CAG9093196.1 unnamed protein product [Bursaphelenchus okinawaensis]
MVLNYASRLFWKRSLIDKKIKNSHALMLANGFFYQTCKGQFAFLPLGQRVLDKLSLLIEAELNNIGGQKCSLPSMAPASLWKRTGRWQEYGSIMFKLKDRERTEFCLQPTAEEMMTDIVANYGTITPGALPLLLYQTTEKYRNEERPEFGSIRCSQFLMNDLYSFDVDKATASETYGVISAVYKRILFNRLGLNETRMVEADNGDMGGDVSHEYHLPNVAAQDHIGVCNTCGSSRLWGPDVTCEPCNTVMQKMPTIEIGHTFMLGTRYTEAFGAKDEGGVPYFMNCFGLGVTRLLGASIDLLSSATIMRLPEALSVFKVAIILPKPISTSSASLDFAYSIMNDLDDFEHLKDDILIEDRTQKSVGQRLTHLNQLGIPHIFVVQAKKSYKPHDTIRIEYFRTEPRSFELIDCGILNHSQMFDVLRNIDRK